MKIMKAKWIQFIFLAVLICTSAAIEDEDVGNANEYVDIVLENLRNESEIIKQIDPLTVPDLHESTYSLKNIKVRGLPNLYRNGDCSLSYENDTINIVAEVAVKDVEITMDYSAKALFFWIHGDGDVAVDHLAVKLDLSSENGNARLNSFKVVNLGNYYVKSIRGATFLLNWLVKIIANKAAQGARGTIIEALEKEAKNALDNVLKEHKIPIY